MRKQIKVKKIDEQRLETLLNENIKKETEAPKTTAKASENKCAPVETPCEEKTLPDMEISVIENKPRKISDYTNVVYAIASPEEKIILNLLNNIADDITINNTFNINNLEDIINTIYYDAYDLTYNQKEGLDNTILQYINDHIVKRKFNVVDLINNLNWKLSKMDDKELNEDEFQKLNPEEFKKLYDRINDLKYNLDNETSRQSNSTDMIKKNIINTKNFLEKSHGNEVNNNDKFLKHYGDMTTGEFLMDIPKENAETTEITPCEQYEHVNHPTHYNNYDVEVIEMMERIWGPEKTAVFCELNAFKYRMRMGTKPDNNIEQDLKKEKWYIKKYHELKEKLNIK